MTESVAIVSKSGEFLESADVVLPIYSITKSYIAACVFAAGIDINERISSWFDDRLVSRGDEISVRQLLNHTSGIRDYGALPSYHEAIQSGRVWTDDDFVEITLRNGLLFDPGSQWSYSNPGYWLLSKIIQNQCNLSFTEYIEKFVTDPLGLTSTYVAAGVYADDLENHPADWVWHGLLMSNASDVVRFMNSDLVKPMLNDNDLISVPIDHPEWESPAWAYGLMVDKRVRYGHNGDGPKYSAACFHFIEPGITGCVLCSAESEGLATSRLLSIVNLGGHPPVV